MLIESERNARPVSTSWRNIAQVEPYSADVVPASAYYDSGSQYVTARYDTSPPVLEITSTDLPQGSEIRPVTDVQQVPTAVGYPLMVYPVAYPSNAVIPYGSEYPMNQRRGFLAKAGDFSCFMIGTLMFFCICCCCVLISSIIGAATSSNSIAQTALTEATCRATSPTSNLITSQYIMKMNGIVGNIQTFYLPSTTPNISVIITYSPKSVSCESCDLYLGVIGYTTKACFNMDTLPTFSIPIPVSSTGCYQLFTTTATTSTPCAIKTSGTIVGAFWVAGYASPSTVPSRSPTLRPVSVSPSQNPTISFHPTASNP